MISDYEALGIILLWFSALALVAEIFVLRPLRRERDKKRRPK